jgi:serine phosphatase RsbU (regulator of sigma subunit)
LVYDIMEKRDSALYYYQQALSEFLAMDLPAQLANTYSNIGVVHFYLKNYDEAIKNYELALEVNKRMDYDESKANNLLNLGEAYAAKNDFKAAEKYYMFGLSVLNKTNNLEYKKEAYRMIADFYNKTDRNEQAYKYHLRYSKISDSIYDMNSTRAVAEMQVRFDTEKKEQENRILQVENHEQRVVTYFIIGGLVLSLVLGLFIFKSYREKKKTNIALERSNCLIQSQKKEVEHQKELVEEKHKEITDSINYAERIQRSFLATKTILDDNLKDYFVFFRPRDVVSGDFYWASTLNNGNFALVTADSTGHGVPGAIMSLLNVTSLEKAIETNSDPSAILNETRKIIIERLKKDGSSDGGKDGMDASLIAFDKQKKKLVIAAANNPVWIVRNNESIEIKPDKMPVGKHDKQDVSFKQHEVDLQKGDVIYTLTDGFPDQFGGEKGKKFMTKNLRALLVANAHLPMEEQKKLLESTFVNWVGSLEQIDDVTMIGIRI